MNTYKVINAAYLGKRHHKKQQEIKRFLWAGKISLGFQTRIFTEASYKASIRTGPQY